MHKISATGASRVASLFSPKIFHSQTHAALWKLDPFNASTVGTI